MQVLSAGQFNRPICLALGFFDCVHLGHRALFDRVIEQAESCGALPCVVTFCNNPYPLLQKGDRLVYTFDERLRLFEQYGLYGVYAVPFDADYMQTDKRDFLQTLFRSFTVRGVVCGYDYRFGARAEGNADYLREFCHECGTLCDIVIPFRHNGVRVSTTAVRELLLSGDIGQATQWLGHAYFITGRVCHGRGVGKLFDFPTANLQPPAEKLLPKRGVYATFTTVDGKRYKSVTNVGNKPTFKERDDSVETFLLDFAGDLYNKEITVEFVRYLRDIRSFESPQVLYAQIRRDSEWRI